MNIIEVTEDEVEEKPLKTEKNREEPK